MVFIEYPTLVVAYAHCAMNCVQFEGGVSHRLVGSSS